MTWIKVIDVPETEGPLRKAYNEVTSTRGEVRNILKAHSLCPKVLTAHLHLYPELIIFTNASLSHRRPGMENDE